MLESGLLWALCHAGATETIMPRYHDDDNHDDNSHGQIRVDYSGYLNMWAKLNLATTL